MCRNQPCYPGVKHEWKQKEKCISPEEEITLGGKCKGVAVEGEKRRREASS